MENINSDLLTVNILLNYIKGTLTDEEKERVEEIISKDPENYNPIIAGLKDMSIVYADDLQKEIDELENEKDVTDWAAKAKLEYQKYREEKEEVDKSLKNMLVSLSVDYEELKNIREGGNDPFNKLKNSNIFVDEAKFHIYLAEFNQKITSLEERIVSFDEKEHQLDNKLKQIEKFKNKIEKEFGALINGSIGKTKEESSLTSFIKEVITQCMQSHLKSLPATFSTHKHHNLERDFLYSCTNLLDRIPLRKVFITFKNSCIISLGLNKSAEELYFDSFNNKYKTDYCMFRSVKILSGNNTSRGVICSNENSNYSDFYDSEQNKDTRTFNNPFCSIGEALHILKEDYEPKEKLPVYIHFKFEQYLDKNLSRSIRVHFKNHFASKFRKSLAMIVDLDETENAKIFGADYVGLNDLIDDIHNGDIRPDYIIVSSNAGKKITTRKLRLLDKYIRKSPKVKIISNADNLSKAVIEIREDYPFEIDEDGIVHASIGHTGQPSFALSDKAYEVVRCIYGFQKNSDRNTLRYEDKNDIYSTRVNSFNEQNLPETAAEGSRVRLY